MATQCNFDDFEVGCMISVETSLKEKFIGRVVTFDPSVNILVLHAPESREMRFFNTTFLQKCTLVGRSEDPLRGSVVAKTVFMVQLQSANLFHQSLISMKEISPNAVMEVRGGENELRVSSRDAASLASMVLEAETMLPFPSGCFAFRFNAFAFTGRFQRFVDDLHLKSRHSPLLEGKTLWIYKMKDIDDLCFLLGLNPHPLSFKPQGETERQTDLRDLHLLPVNVTLTAEWFRKLLNFFDVERSVSVELTDNFLIWQSGEKSLRLEDPTEYSVQGSLDDKPRRLEVEFIHRKALLHASFLSKTADISLARPDKEATDKCILFRFPINRNSHFSVGLSPHADIIEQKKISRRK